MIGRITIGLAVLAIGGVTFLGINKLLKEHNLEKESKIKIGFDDKGTCYYTQESYKPSKEEENPCVQLITGTLDLKKIEWIQGKGIDSVKAKLNKDYEKIRKFVEEASKEYQSY